MTNISIPSPLPWKIANTRTDIFSAIIKASGKYGSNRVAIIDGDGTEIPYKNVLRGGFALGSALSRHLDKGETVGIMLPTGVGAVVAFCAVLKSGRLPAMMNFTEMCIRDSNRGTWVYRPPGRHRRTSVRRLVRPRTGSLMSHMFPERVRNLGLLVMDEAAERRVKIATAESCTGGLLAALFTEFAGSSKVLERGFVTYSNPAKSELLSVPGDILADYGAVSEPVARLMAEGALEASRANLAISITGIAGPGGGTPMKPVGTVHIACARENKAMMHEMLTLGDIGRHEVRMATLEAALEMIRAQI